MIGDAKRPAALWGRRVVFAGIALWLLWLNVVWLLSFQEWARGGFWANDWSLLATLDAANPYANPAFHWSVPAAWLWTGVVVPMGFLAWSALHFAALATIRDWRVVAASLLTFPFWFDLGSGNMLTFAFVAAWHALAGRRWGIVVFCVLAAFVPRPLMLPVLAVLLWRSGTARLAFGAAAVVVVFAGLATGTLGDWLRLLVIAPANEYGAVWNIGPSSIIGVAWVPIGLVLAAVLTWRGHIGLASLAISPYLIHYYAIMVLLELHLHDAPVEHRRGVQVPRRAGLRGVDFQLELGRRDVGVDVGREAAPSP
jgi:hypothetical protein